MQSMSIRLSCLFADSLNLDHYSFSFHHKSQLISNGREAIFVGTAYYYYYRPFFSSHYPYELQIMNILPVAKITLNGIRLAIPNIA